MILIQRARVALMIAMAVGAAACGNRSQPLDDALKADLAAAGGGTADLQLAPAAAKSQVVVSAIEGGPTATPKRAAPKIVSKPSVRPTTRVAAKRAPAPEPAATQQAETMPAPSAPTVEAPAPAPAPMPTPAPRQDNRVYKTEAEIFRQMPWIKP